MSKAIFGFLYQSLWVYKSASQQSKSCLRQGFLPALIMPTKPVQDCPTCDNNNSLEFLLLAMAARILARPSLLCILVQCKAFALWCTENLLQSSAYEYKRSALYVHFCQFPLHCRTGRFSTSAKCTNSHCSVMKIALMQHTLCSAAAEAGKSRRYW